MLPTLPNLLALQIENGREETITHIIVWIVLGALAALLVGLASKKGSAGRARDIGMGVLGAVVGGKLVNVMGFGTYVAGLNVFSLVVAFVAAALTVFTYNAVRRRGAW
jgi:uncharacterized membrane protein YeaQ/YmgE (transglycosylase-associated protein family)